MFAVNFDRLQQTRLQREPFEYVVVPDFLKPEALSSLQADFPQITEPGSFPIDHLHYGPALESLLQELTGADVRAEFESKFEIGLKHLPSVVSVRGHCGPQDGRIHTDLPGKVITLLLYLNTDWDNAGGRLRLLRSANDMEDVIVEIPPMAGTLLAFRRRDNSFHGHKPFIGERRVLQVNWITRRHLWALRKEEATRRLARLVKRCVPTSRRLVR